LLYFVCLNAAWLYGIRKRNASLKLTSLIAEIRPINDHMDTLRLYREYKHYWDKHRIPGETKINEVLWEDTWVIKYSIEQRFPTFL